jgi:PAS domain S-box-containing protein
VNQAARKITGRSVEEFVGQGLRELVHPEDHEGVVSEWETLTRTHVAFRSTRRYLHKDGKSIWINMNCTPVHDGETKRGYMGIIEDVTERKQMDEQLLRSQRMESIGTLAGGVAHDLNNVLAPILMSVESLKCQITDEANRKLIAMVEASARHGADLVSQVLSFARGVQGQSIPLNVAHLLNEIGNMIRDTFPKNIEFSFSPCRDPWLVTGDPTHLRQVFTNLCVNARDAMPEGGCLKVAMENVLLDDVYGGMNPDAKAGAYLAVSVEDTGVGIPPAVADKIFEPFFTTKEIGKGTGLGLSTTMAIVKSHGGFINFHSEPAKGSVFKVYLPADAAAKSNGDAAARKAGLPRGNGEMVLFVDDDERLRTVAESTLKQFGYRVLLAANGAEAVALYAQHREQIAIVLTDMTMPVMDGPSSIVALKVLYPGVKIIGSSGFSSNGGDAKARSAGIKHFIPKPYTAEALLNILSLALREDT